MALCNSEETVRASGNHCVVMLVIVPLAVHNSHFWRAWFSFLFESTMKQPRALNHSNPADQENASSIAMESPPLHDSVALNMQRINLFAPYLVCLLLVGLSLGVYWQTARFDFINYDDDKYVTQNAQVQAGLTRGSLVWAFTTMHSANWHPLTWLSHMLDCKLYGLKPAGHHLTSVFFHLANSVLLLLVLNRMTGDLWRSAMVAALFAIHPLHVESVAWVAERKDVLSTFFGLIALWFYVLHAESARLKRYLIFVLAYALSLMAKPMWVTFPFLLLLLDHWPLGRLGWATSKTGGVEPKKRTVFREKIPLFCLSSISCIVTYIAQQKGGAVVSIEQYSLAVRTQNALITYVGYLWKMIWPSGLACFYPYHRLGVPTWQVLLALIFLISVTVLAWRSIQHRPYLAVGWLWYLGTLVPVIGLVQVGGQAMADRYTYLPLVGIFIAVVWGVPSLFVRRSKFRQPLSATLPAPIRKGLAVASGTVVLSLASCTWTQAGYWRSSISLYEHALKVARGNYLAHNNLAGALAGQGKIDEAIAHYMEALRLAPTVYQAHFALAQIFSGRGKVQEAITHLTEGLQINSDNPTAEDALGELLHGQGRTAEAIDHYSKAVRLKSDYGEAHNNLGVSLSEVGRVDEAIAEYREALRITSDEPFVHNNLAIALESKKEMDQAIYHYTEALRIRPEFAGAHNNLGYALAHAGRIGEAIKHYREALRIDPKYGAARANLASALLAAGNPAEAWKEVKLCRKYGVPLIPVFLQALSTKMPEP
jgi:tetratricopeptide (TPR) repeat protein